MAEAIPPPLPLASAPYGCSLCIGLDCRTVSARKSRLGGWPACTACGNRTTRHPDTVPKKVARAPVEHIDWTPGNLEVMDRMPRLYRGMSLLDYWDADNECAHDQLPHEACGPCGREASPAPPQSIQAVVTSERGLVC